MNPKFAEKTYRRFRGLLRWLVLAVVLAGNSVHAQPQVSKEYQVKAAFLFNFAQFVDWPTNAFADAHAPLSIGVLGDDPFGPALTEIIRGESIHNHPLTVVRSNQVRDLENCQIIFVSKTARHLDEILSAVKSRGILTVGETDGFAQRGGIIDFYLEGNKVRFEINPSAAQREGLKISSQLFALGKIVDTQAGP